MQNANLFAYVRNFLYICAKLAQMKKDKLLYNAARVYNRAIEDAEERIRKKRIRDMNDMNSNNPNKGDILIYQSEDGLTHIDVRMEQETVWLTQQQMAELFQSSRTNVVEHIQHIYEEGELTEEATCRNFRQVQQEGNRMVTREIPFYNLDMIISLGYRIRSVVATRFRQWATKRLNEYIVKGFTMDDERLKKLGGGNYWKELLDRIRDIRSSEKVLYRQVLDLYATSVDYNPKSELSIEFFKIVQNKLHFAAHGHTAAEVIYQRADSGQPFMGMTNLKAIGRHLKRLSLQKIIS